MKKTVIVLASVLLLSFAVAACGGGSSGASGGGSDEDAIKNVVAREVDAVNNGDMRALYDSYSPQAHSFCTYDNFVSSVDYTVHKNYGVSNLTVTVNSSGSAAKVTGTITYDGGQAPLGTADDPNPYLKYNGQWYDDAVIPCSGSGSDTFATRAATATATLAPTARVTATPAPRRTSTAAPTPKVTTIAGGTFTVVVDGQTTRVGNATCTIKTTTSGYSLRIESGADLLLTQGDLPAGGADITRTIIIFVVGGGQYTGNITGTIGADLRSGTFSGTFVIEGAGETAQVTGSFSC